MTPDYKGLYILNSFLSSISVHELNNTELVSIVNLPDFSEGSSLKEKILGCKICRISNFNTLQEFKLHRQSEEHLSNLTNSLSFSDEIELQEKFDQESSCLNDLPVFEIVHNSKFIKCFKVLLASRKEDLYSKTNISLDLNLYNRLKNLKDSYISLFLNGGGYFAAAIFDNSKMQMICSKTFRRYTTRRKQGGSQSLKDNQKSGIHSAGSLIRRDNEKKLKEEIQNLISSWKHDIEKSSVIFCNRDVSIQEACKDFSAKIRAFPFTTYQANFDEICRCYTELISSIKN